MSNPPQFLNEFISNMNRLRQMNQTVQQTINDKNTFNNRLTQRLKSINDLIQKLSGSINNLKQKIDGLQGQVNTNSNSIGEKDKQVAAFTQQLKQLEGERATLSQQLADLQNRTNGENSAIQKRIDEYERRLRELTTQNATLDDQARALDNELKSKGDLPRQHAEEIQRQTDGFNQELEKQRQANQVEIDKLRAKISSDEASIQNLQRQLQDKTNEAASHAQNVTNAQNQIQGQIAQLTTEKNELIAQNQYLSDRIKEANNAIVQAMTNLQALSESAPNVQNQKDLQDLLGQIEASIMAINTAMQTGPSPAPNRVEINVLDQTGNPFTGVRKIQQQIALNKLQEKLRSESLPDRRKKIEDAIAFIQTNKENPDAVGKYLQNANLKFEVGNNNVTLGGKKRTTTKRKKTNQKGGFTYKNSKRRSIRSSPRSVFARGRGKKHTKK